MGVYDNEVVLDWTPHEYLTKLKGAQHAMIDGYERLAISAVMQARANNEKRISVNKLFNADKARRKLDHGDGTDPEVKRMAELNKAFRGWQPTTHFKPKGG